MNGELGLRHFVKSMILIGLLLWQPGHEFKFQTTADQDTTDRLLPQEEVDTLNDIARRLKPKEPDVFSKTDCKYRSSVDPGLRDSAGIFCNCSFDNNTTCRISTIRWNDKGLDGIIPEEVANLTHLERLDLAFNEIHDQIPLTLGKMRSLYYLDLSNNQLSGTIPGSLGNLKVEYLYMENNLLTGPIPPSLGNISNLIVMYLSENQLDGSLPPELGNLTSLKSLFLDENQFTGSLPLELGHMASLRDLWLAENQLNGSLPRELGNLKSLRFLDLGSNYISGTIPGDYKRLTNLYEFSISGNCFSGTLPKFIKKWTSIKYLSFDGNNFRGKIPPEIFKLSSLIILKISDIETFPDFQLPESANLSSITTLVLRNCSITGGIPRYIAEMSELKYLDLSFNKLTNKIPSELKILNLTYMSFANNNLNGTIPAWISGHAAKQTQIDLSYNQFDGFVPLPPDQSSKQMKSNLNLFSCCPSCNSSKCTIEMKSVEHLNSEYCSSRRPKSRSLYINCGGDIKEKDQFGNQHDQDNSTLPSQVSPNHSWAFSTSGSFFLSDSNSSNYIEHAKCGISVTDAPLYLKARHAPVSLKYYGFCLLAGNYNVTLRFAELVYTGDDAEHNNLYKRFFDVYIQNKMVQRDFNINQTARSGNGTANAKPMKIAHIENYTTEVINDGLLKIHLYWAGKGSSLYNGPILSAISVTPDFKPEVEDEKRPPLQIAMISLGSITFAVLLLLAFAWMMGWLTKEELHEITVGDGTTVTHKQLIVATRGFSKDVEIGRGGFGTVYRAELPDHRFVAIKKLSTLSNEGIEKLNVGVYNLQNLRHDNLVRLFDIYVGKDLCFLVYEYMENKSLADALFEHKIKLNWDARFNICVGIAKGLQYLHDHPRLKMVHWGIKAANILLDGELKPKISDLGLASTSVENENEASHFLWMMKTEASSGYMAPEYPTIGKKSGYKYDVYSFGVVMLEIVCGRKNVGAGLKNKHELELLVDEVCIADSKGKLPSLVDESLSGTYDMKQAMTILKLAMKCTHISPGVRPTMSQVVSVLADEKLLDEISAPASKDDEKTIEGSSEDLAIDADQFSAIAST